MSQWKNDDSAANTPSWAVAQFGKAANSLNQAALFGNTTANALFAGVTIALLGVAPAEMAHTGVAGDIYTVNVSAPGSNYASVPTVSFSGDGTGGTADVNAKLVALTVAHGGNNYAPGDLLLVAGGTKSVNGVINVVTTEIRSFAVNAAGSGYANGNVVTVLTGTGTAANGVVTTGGATTNVASVALGANAGVYTVNPTITNVATTNTTGTGTGLTLNLTTKVLSVGISNAGVYTVLPTIANNQVTNATGVGVSANVTLSFGINAVVVTDGGGNNYTASPNVVFSVGGTTNAVAASIIYDSVSARASKGIAHAGWNLRTVGQGGRAGRVTYETLVAMGSMTGDAPDDPTLPE